MLLRDHVVRQPVPPSHLRQSLPRELDAIVMRCLAKDPSLRYMRASDVVKALGSLENIGHALATTRVAVMNEPLQGIVPHIEESPVVALLQTYGHPIRRTFFALLAAAPAFGLMTLAQFDLIPSAVAAVLVGAIAITGHLGLALALGWIIETACIFLFVPALAVVFAFMGLWVWLRDVPAERTATAIAMPALGPVGLAPAFVLASAAIHGLGGVVGVAWGAVLTVVFAVAAGRASLGPYIQTGIALEPNSLFDPSRAFETKTALLYVLRPGDGDRFAPLLKAFGPETLAQQIGTLVSRLSTADVTAIATVLAWVVAALVVWTVTRLLRSLFDTVFGTRRLFALYVFATAVGISAGAAILYMTYVTWAPLAFAPGRPASAVLFVSAVVGAVVALALGVIVSATETPHHDDDLLPSAAGAI